MSKILVTGATGLLGCSLVPFLKERGHQVICMGHSHATDLNIDLTSLEQTTRALNQAKPEVIINLTALTNVDRCETHPQQAYLLNVKTVDNICTWMKTTGHTCYLIQISTDQMYDGPGPHAEGELTIRNNYAMSKLAAEYAARIVPSTILRTNFVGRSRRKDRAGFTDWLYSALQGSSAINVFDDVKFSPLSTNTLCGCIEKCAIGKPIGVFNLGSRDGMSKADFAFGFAAAVGLPSTNLTRASDRILAKLVAKRPADMRMKSDRFENVMRRQLPPLAEEIESVAAEYSLANPVR